MIAEVWEGYEGWFAQLVDARAGVPEGMLFMAKSRGAVIAQIRMWVPLTHMPIKDCYNPTMR